MSRALELPLTANVGGVALALLVAFRRDGRACGARLLEPHAPVPAEVLDALDGLDKCLAHGMRVAGLANALKASDLERSLCDAVAAYERACRPAVIEAYGLLVDTTRGDAA